MMQSTSSINVIVTYTRDVAARRASLKKGIKFFLRSVWHFKSARQWLRFLGPYYTCFGFERAPMYLIIKHTRAYGSRHLTVAETVRRLQAHYSFIAAAFSRDIVRKLLSEERIVVCTLTGKTGQSYAIHLHHSNSFRQEGELTLSLYDEKHGCDLQYLTFSIARLNNGAPFIWIGGFQGARVTDAKERIVKATRDLHGLRPKAIMLESIYPVAEFIRAAELRAIASHNHPFAGSKRRFFADYDHFWEESGGVRNQDGNFLLPATMKRRTLEDVPSHKRKDWLKRQEYVSLIQTEIRTSLNSFGAAPAFAEEFVAGAAWGDDSPASVPGNRHGEPIRSAEAAGSVPQVRYTAWLEELLSSLLPKPAFCIAATLALGLVIGIYLPALAGIHNDASAYEESD